MMSPVTTANVDSKLKDDNQCLEPRFIISSETTSGYTDHKSQSSSLSDSESYECYGENCDIDVDSGISTERNACDGLTTQISSNNADKRNTWLQTGSRHLSPRKKEPLSNRRWGSFRHTAKRQLGSNALASQLYRSSSFNSSGRSSTCDTADDMFSDASLEEDVLDLNHKVLQQQVGLLQDTANHNDERYTRAKVDNASLQTRVLMLEEQLRDVELRSESRLQEEQKRSKELITRIEREKQLQIENAQIRLQSAELETLNLKEEVLRQNAQIKKLELERNQLNEQIDDLKNELLCAKEFENTCKEDERRFKQDQIAQNILVEELSREIEKLRYETRTPALPSTFPETLRLEELHEEMALLREKNSQLQEANDELQASILTTGVEQGHLLTAGETSLAVELEEMTPDQIQHALKEQQDVNIQLRAYIDGILLNIVENYPHLLEVKQKPVQ